MNAHARSILVSFGLLVTFSAFAHEESVSSTLNSEDGIPVPTKIVRPGVEPHQVGKVVLVRFTVTEEGRATRIQTVSPRPEDPALAARVIHALRSWEFSPARDENGQPVAATVRMPIKVDRIGQT